MKRTIEEIEDEMDALQAAYVEEEDEILQIKISRKFSLCLQEATDLDGVDRIAAAVTITNWVRESSD